MTKFLPFLRTSGIGWLLDFSIYLFLVKQIELDVSHANMLSAIPAITFVFFVSTKKIFQISHTNVPVQGKFLMYVVYQFLLVYCVSHFNLSLYHWMSQWYLLDSLNLTRYIAFICKLCITPITMTCNFFVMKFLIEKL